MTPDPDGISAGDASSQPVARELRDLLRIREQRRRHLPRALLVGVVAGLVAVGFARGLDAAGHLRTLLTG